ncbi:MAG: glycosyltransferase [Thermoflexales bacterium]|nr:glycosyltransferase [Thermoflexales bacterium]
MIKRIACISVHTSPLATLGGKDTGGMNVYVREVARECARRGIAIDVFTRSASTSNLRIDPRIAPNARVIHVPAGPEAPIPKGELRSILPAFTEWICAFGKDEEVGYDIIHAHYWLSGLVAEELGKCWGVPFVQTFHTLAELKNQIAQRPEDLESDERTAGECHVCSVAGRITAATSVEWDQLVHIYGAGSSIIRTIPPGVDTARFNPIEPTYARRVIGVGKSHRVIVFAGRIEPLKGIDTLLRAIAILRTRYPEYSPCNLCVPIVGGDPSEAGARANAEMGRLLSLRDELDLGDLITFVGAQDQDSLHFYFSAADCLVMPSHYESFGMVALEAMACGTPVICSDVGGLSQLVRHGETGLRVPPRDPEALADAINYLLSDEPRRRRMGHSAACLAEDYDWARIVDKLTEVYEELV